MRYSAIVESEGGVLADLAVALLVVVVCLAFLKVNKIVKIISPLKPLVFAKESACITYPKSGHGLKDIFEGAWLRRPYHYVWEKEKKSSPPSIISEYSNNI